MALRLRIDGLEKPREFEFDRDMVSLGRGPLNDICVPHEAIAKRGGVFEVGEGTAKFVYLGGDGFLAAHRRGDAIQRAPESSSTSWEIVAGDEIVFGPGRAELVVTVLETPMDNVQTSPHFMDVAHAHDESPASLIGRFVSRDPTAGALLRGLAGIVFSRTGHLPKEASLTLEPLTEAFYAQTFVLRAPKVEKGMGAGVVRQGPDTLRRLGVRGVEILDGISDDSKAAVVPLDEGLLIAVGVHLHEHLAAVVTARFEDLPGAEADDVAAAMHELDGLARLVVRHIELEKSERSLAEENRYFRERERRHYLFKDLICESDSMMKVYDELNTLVDGSTPVLIHGEAGTGKELIARALHHLGPRKQGMLISLNCSRLDDTDVDIELFGSVQSRLSGAVAARKGIFELAEGGTVYLAEVDSLSPLMQGKLVRMLNEGEVRRAGDSESREIDARLVVSVHRDLHELVREGAIRRDLYLLLTETILHVPALEERAEDIMPLARVFLRQFAKRYRKKLTGFSPAVEERFLTYDWPGNARELQARVESAALKSAGPEVGISDLDVGTQ